MHTQQDTKLWVEEKCFATKNGLVKWGKQPRMRNSNSTTNMGIAWAESTAMNHKIVNPYWTLTKQSKNEFLGMENEVNGNNS